MKPEIQLKSRGGLDNRLVQVEEEPLKFKLETNYPYRVGFKDDNIKEYTFIDPAGGPFIHVGEKLSEINKIVKSITEDKDNNILIEFE